MQTPDHVIVISLQKSGTHLLQNIFHRLGYSICGDASRIARGMHPAFTRDEALTIAGQVYDANKMRWLFTADNITFQRHTRDAWERLSWWWLLRLGVATEARHGAARMRWLKKIVHEAPSPIPSFSALPGKLCWLLHELDVDKLDKEFLRTWEETGTPRIILNYRDPRDVLLSFVRYLCGATGRGYGSFRDYQAPAREIQALPSLSDQLAYALHEPDFPGRDDYRNALWLLRHERVCKTSFEELVGTQGGGSSQVQRLALSRVLRHLTIPAADETIDQLASVAFDQGAYTFYRGQIGGWRKALSAAHLEVFEARFGDILRLYGYS